MDTQKYSVDFLLTIYMQIFTAVVHFCVAFKPPTARWQQSSAIDSSTPKEELKLKLKLNMAEDRGTTLQPAPAAFKANVWTHFGFKTKEGSKDFDKSHAVCKLCNARVKHDKFASISEAPWQRSITC